MLIVLHSPLTLLHTFLFLFTLRLSLMRCCFRRSLQSLLPVRYEIMDIMLLLRMLYTSIPQGKKHIPKVLPSLTFILSLSFLLPVKIITLLHHYHHTYAGSWTRQKKLGKGAHHTQHRRLLSRDVTVELAALSNFLNCWANRLTHVSEEVYFLWHYQDKD